jgi:hypothetical protein
MGTGNVNKAKETAISRTPDDDEKDTGAFFLNGTDHDHFQRSDNNAIQRKDDTDEKFVEVPFLLEKQGCDPEHGKKGHVEERGYDQEFDKEPVLPRFYYVYRNPIFFPFAATAAYGSKKSMQSPAMMLTEPSTTNSSL